MKRIEKLLASAFEKIKKIDVLKSVLEDIESAAAKIHGNNKGLSGRKSK